MYSIKGIPSTLFAEDILNPAFAELEQNLIPLVPIEITRGWIDHLVFARRLIQATKAPRAHLQRTYYTQQRWNAL